VLYPTEDGHPSQYWLGSMQSNFVDMSYAITDTPNHHEWRVKIFHKVVQQH